MILHSPGSASGHGFGRHWLPSMERGPTKQVERFACSCPTHVDSTLVYKLVTSCGTYTELLRFRFVSTAWSNVETPYEVLEHRIWEITTGYGGFTWLSAARYWRGLQCHLQILP